MMDILRNKHKHNHLSLCCGKENQLTTTHKQNNLRRTNTQQNNTGDKSNQRLPSECLFVVVFFRFPELVCVWVGLLFDFRTKKTDQLEKTAKKQIQHGKKNQNLSAKPNLLLESVFSWFPVISLWKAKTLQVKQLPSKRYMSSLFINNESCVNDNSWLLVVVPHETQVKLSCLME